MPTRYSMPIEMSTSACVVDARRVGARPRAVRRVAPASCVDLHVGRTSNVAANRLAELKQPLAGLVLEALNCGLELGRHKIAVDVVPIVVIARAGECHVVSTGPHLGTIGPQLTSKFHPHDCIMRRQRRRARPT